MARENDLIACFMTKPFMGVSASGCHHNLSLWRGGGDELVACGQKSFAGMSQNFLHRKGGKNTFMPRARTRASRDGSGSTPSAA